MNKKVLATKMAEDCGITLIKAKKIIKTITEIFKEYLPRDKKIEIRGFGSFKILKTKKRKIKLIGQKTLKELPPSKRIKFKPFVKL